MKQICYIIALLIFIFGHGQSISSGGNASPIIKSAIKSTYDPYADIISCGLKDKAGNLWFAASGRGVYRYNGKTFTNFTKKDSLSSNDVSCIYEDTVGILWFGTNAGICRYNGKTFTSFPIPEPDSTNAPHSKYSYSKNTKQLSNILQDKKGNFWFVTLNSGVYCYNGKTFTNFSSHEVLDCIAEDKAGNIWVGSWSHGGIYRYDGKTFTHFDGLSDDMIRCMLVDTAGNIWIGTRNHGVDRYDGKSITNFSEKEGLCHNDVSCIFEDKTGNLWFGSDVSDWGTIRGDACRYDGKSFTNVTTKESLAKKDSIKYSVITIIEDKTGNFWFGSRGGLLLSYNGKSFIDFSEKVSK